MKKYKVGQIWRRDTTNNYFAIIKKKGSDIKIFCISSDEGMLGNKFERSTKDLKKRYCFVIDCIACGTSRIRHIAPFELAKDGCCWSCV